VTSLLLALSLAASAAGVAPVPHAHELTGQDVELKTPDGWTLKAKYSPAMSEQRTIVLLHGKGERKEIWYYLTRNLAKTGFGFLAPDLRGHGQSQVGPDGKPAIYKQFKTGKADNDFIKMDLDAQATVDFLKSQNVPEENIGFVGTDLGGIIALRYAAVHPKIPYVVMLSPAMQYQDVPSVSALLKYKDRPLLMIYSELDKTASRDAPVLYGFAKQYTGERNAMQVSVPKIHGVKLPANGPVIKQVIDWLILPVKPEAPVVSTDTAVGGSSTPVEGEPEAPAPSPEP